MIGWLTLWPYTAPFKSARTWNCQQKPTSESNALIKIRHYSCCHFCDAPSKSFFILCPFHRNLSNKAIRKCKSSLLLWNKNLSKMIHRLLFAFVPNGALVALICKSWKTRWPFLHWFLKKEWNEKYLHYSGTVLQIFTSTECWTTPRTTDLSTFKS